METILQAASLLQAARRAGALRRRGRGRLARATKIVGPEWMFHPDGMAVDHYENFPVASLLLPARLRGAVKAIYRFARSADDLADEGQAAPEERLRALAAYRAELHRIGLGPAGGGPDPDPALAQIFAPLADAIARHQLPLAPFYDLLSAFEQDVRVARYETYDALLDYCSRSANPVGRLMLHLYGAANDDNLRLADAICTGLQLANFWQDVRLDWNKGRVYVPQEELRRHGLSDADIARQAVTPAWSEMMRAQTARARAQLQSGAPLAGRIGGRIGLELRLVVQGGLRILECIDATGGDVFLKRPELGPRDWAVMLWRACRAAPWNTETNPR